MKTNKYCRSYPVPKRINVIYNDSFKLVPKNMEMVCFLYIINFVLKEERFVCVEYCVDYVDMWCLMVMRFGLAHFRASLFHMKQQARRVYHLLLVLSAECSLLTKHHFQWYWLQRSHNYGRSPKMTDLHM